MSNSKGLLEYALKTISSRRARAREIAVYRKSELYGQFPRLVEIENELAETAPELVHLIMIGEKVSTKTVDTKRKENIELQEERGAILALLGKPADYLEPPYTCKLCRDNAYVNSKLCQCTEKLMREEKLRRLNATSSLELSSFDDFTLEYYPDIPDASGTIPHARMRGIYEQCVQFAKEFTPQNGKNLLLMGATGLGKTHLSLAIAEKVIEKDCDVIYGSVQDLFRRTEIEKFGREGSSYDTLDSLLSCDLLILDDLGAEFVTSYSTSILYNLVNTRISNCKSTIISTNLSLKELNRQYADRVISRIIGNYSVLWFKGNDIRRILLEKR